MTAVYDNVKVEPFLYIHDLLWASVRRTKQKNVWFGVLVLMALYPLPGWGQSGANVLTTVGSVHDLPAAEAGKPRRVHLVATVTYYDPSTRNLFVEDQTGGVYVWTRRTYAIRRGDVVDIQGMTQPSFRTTIAPDAKIEVVAAASQQQHALRLTTHGFGQLMSGEWDCRYATITGVVRSALPIARNGITYLEIELAMPGGLVQIYVQKFNPADLTGLLDADVAVTGVVAANLNTKLQLMHSIMYATSLKEDVRVLQSPRLALGETPLTAIDAVEQTRSVFDHSPRVRVRGAVTFYRPGRSIVIMQNGQSLSADTRETKHVQLGSLVDLVGFAVEGGYGPRLGQTEILTTGLSESVVPKKVSYSDAVSGRFNDELVRIRGKVIATVHADHSDTVSLLVDDHAVTAVLEQNADPDFMKRIPNGATVSVVGICRISTTWTIGNLNSAPVLFLVDMRSPSDLQVLQWPSWWTVTHLLKVLAAVLLISLIVTAWALALRKRISRQNREIQSNIVIERERGRLLEAINAHTPLVTLIQAVHRFVETQAPDLSCFTNIDGSQAGGHYHHHAVRVGNAPGHILFSELIADSNGSPIGTFTSGASTARVLSENETRVNQSAANVVSLAVRQRRMYQELSYTSSHDQLTGLPNRRSSDRRLNEVLISAAHVGKRAGVAYVDINQFKEVNDRYGHKIGDLYLQHIGERINATLNSNASVARIGGDEFLLVVADIEDREDLDGYIRRLDACFEKAFLLDGVRIVGSASVGVALYPDDGGTGEELRKYADLEMYSCKRRNRQQEPSVLR